MKNKSILIVTIIIITACVTSRKIPLGRGSFIQLPNNSRQLSKEQLALENKKYLEALPALDYVYMADNVLITFHNVITIRPNADSFPKTKMQLESMFSDYPATGEKEEVSIKNFNTTQVLIVHAERKKLINIAFFCRDQTNKLTFNGIIQTALADSAKANNDLNFILKHANFGN